MPVKILHWHTSDIMIGFPATENRLIGVKSLEHPRHLGKATIALSNAVHVVYDFEAVNVYPEDDELRLRVVVDDFSCFFAE